MTTSMSWSNKQPYSSVESNPRLREDEVICCQICNAEATMVGYDGKQGLCDVHYDEWENGREHG